MEAKDTVMTGQQALTIKKEIAGDMSKSWLNECCVRQAEISFKEGQLAQKLVCSQCPNAGSCLNTEGCLEEIESEFEAVKKAGIREVVEWIKKEGYIGTVFKEGSMAAYMGDNPIIVSIKGEKWQAKLKDWGL